MPSPEQPADGRANDPLVTKVYDQLRGIARAQMRHLPAGHTLQATALVHEAWLKMSGAEPGLSRDQFAMAAARAMRDVLIDRIRARTAHKRGGGQAHVDVHEDEPAIAPGVPIPDLMSLDTALQELQREHPAAAELVLRRFFGGEAMEEIAQQQRVDVRTVYRTWRFARAFLAQRLGEHGLPEAP